MQYQDKIILIVPSNSKKEVLLQMKSGKNLSSYKLFTMEEIKKNLYFDYDEKTIAYVMEKYECKPDIARMYIENLYYISGAYKQKKLSFLATLKKELEQEHLLYYNPFFSKFLASYSVVIAKEVKSNEIKRIEEDLKKYTTVTFEEEKKKDYIPTIAHLHTLNEEVSFVASKIASLIKQNIRPNHIFLCNLDEEYRIEIEKIFSLFHIPVSLKNTNSIITTLFIKDCLKEMETSFEDAFSRIKERIKTEEEQKLYNLLIRIVNKYVVINNKKIQKELILDEIKRTTIPKTEKENTVVEVDFLTYPFQKEDYVFLLHFNQGSIPRIVKDEDYLNDYLKQELGLETSCVQNKKSRMYTLQTIENTKNLIISFIDTSLSATYYPSSLLEEFSYELYTPHKSFSHSHVYNKMQLVAYQDLFKKYNVVDKNLMRLRNTYTLKKYDSSFKGIDEEKIKQYVNQELKLSYTSLNNYYKCSFRYYLSHILKLDIFEETFMVTIGNIFHKVLEQVFTSPTSFDALYQQAVFEMKEEYTVKERFFLKKLKEELRFIIKTIEEQNSYTNLKEEVYEEQIVTNIAGNIKITFSGKIDKIKYKQEDEKTYVAIIDYKTGNPELNLNHTIYGLDMQLPIYIYLVKHSDKIKNVEVAGFYLQKIVNNQIVADTKHTYEELRKDQLKLQGYSNENFDVIQEFDSSFMDSNVIKSLKVSKTGFYPYSKVLSTHQIERLISLAEENIKSGADAILHADFSINPKVIGGKNIGCEFCKFHDICYMTEKNKVELAEYKKLEFLGGDENA